ncbi:Hypothetical Protein FCC1311_067902 [Hondaea fermentalgiana]|uniref:Uncharacterized protein n=1 Tax=Hondaea fermentalgiana TaxID=2315210 RepID=A0A2R5GI48_9STRA|nr:Hypothetical Protein FCC1311_067902 [Hondaea fermentalgiana]|eukprot:GBG30570.1 Hypothetical Protein FCC1311_067902 [Hondaea fermentalgiana]
MLYAYDSNPRGRSVRYPPNKVEISLGIDELVDVLYSPVPPRVINTRQTIGAMVLGKTFCNGIFLLHKRIPGYNIIGTVLTLAMYACLGHAFWAFEEPRQEIIVALGCLGGWFLVTTLPLTNHCLLKLLLTTFEGRLVLTVQCLSCSIMLYMFPSKATVVIFVISMQLFQGLISDAWPSFITGYRLRAVGHGTNSAMLGAIFYCIQNEAFLGGMHSSRNLEIYLPLGIVVKLKAVLLSAITINLAFTLKWFCLALIGTRLCLILRAPIVLTQMPRSEFQKYERLCFLNLSLGPKGSEPLSKPPDPLHSSPREAGRASVAH